MLTPRVSPVDGTLPRVGNPPPGAAPRGIPGAPPVPPTSTGSSPVHFLGRTSAPARSEHLRRLDLRAGGPIRGGCGHGAEQREVVHRGDDHPGGDRGQDICSNLGDTLNCQASRMLPAFQMRWWSTRPDGVTDNSRIEGLVSMESSLIFDIGMHRGEDTEYYLAREFGWSRSTPTRP